MILFSPGKVLPWDSFRGEGLPYGIPLGGMFAIWYNFRGGGGLGGKNSYVTPTLLSYHSKTKTKEMK